MLIFFLLIAVVAFGNGFSDTIFGNFFKDAYNVDEIKRAFIEFPRELPGVLCVFIIGFLGFMGDIRIALVAQILSCVGVTVLGIFTPSFSVMLVFLFTTSLGMHLFMPLSDVIGMSLAEPEKLGKRIGQYGTIKTAVGFFSGILVFFGFRYSLFTFKTDFKWVFIISGMFYGIGVILAFLLIKATKQPSLKFSKPKIGLVFRKEYKYYYFLTVLNGVQKQIAFVFGSWVIIDLLSKGADIMALLTITGSFCGMFFFKLVGKWIDTKGIKFMMYLDALTFIFVYFIYGIAVWVIVDKVVPDSTFMVILVYILFILDRLSMQVGVVKSVYLKSIAVVKEDVTKALSTGISLDHTVAIISAQISGLIWAYFGAQWVFFFACFLSLGNLFVAWKIKKPNGDYLEKSNK